MRVHEFIEAGWITFGTATAFDISAILPHEAEPENGRARHHRLDPARPVRVHEHARSGSTLAAWLAYIVVVLLPVHAAAATHAGSATPERTPASA